MQFQRSHDVKRITIIAAASLFFMGVYAPSLQSKTINARSCSLTDVQSAVNAAVAGDIIVLPSGSKTWSGSLKIGKKNLTIQGYGIGSTIITTGTKGIALTGESANNLRITRIEFRNGNQLIYASGSGSPAQAVKNLRVDNCKFVKTNVAIETHGAVTGVFDHCVFQDAYAGRIYGSNDPKARPPYKLGTSDALFFEDNTINVTTSGNPPHFIASNSFSKYVVRNNVFNYKKSLWDIVDAHGACEVKGRGSATWEIYNNTFNIVASMSRVIHLRGGQGVVFNNTFAGSYTPSKPVTITDYAVCNGPCTQSCKTYPCPDMINHAFFWSNKIRTSSVNPVNSCGSYIKLNRDYFLGAMPGYVSYTYPHPLTKTALRKETELEIMTMPAEAFSINKNFNGTTRINFNLIDNTPVKMDVYNVNGVHIRTLVDGIQNTGDHSVTLNTNNMPSGLYVLKTSIGDVHKNYTLVK
jgi:hypothetical protein